MTSNRTFRKAISLLLTLAMLFSMGSTAFAVGGEETGNEESINLDLLASKFYVTRANAVQKVYDYFNWSHHDEYNDIWAPEMDHFTDVTNENPNYLAIECALQQGIVLKTDEFRPEDELTFGEALYMLQSAFGVSAEDVIASFPDDWDEEAYIPNRDWNASFAYLTENFVSPVQALPIASSDDNGDYSAPRRYLKFWTPTEGATIYFRKAFSTEGYIDDFELDIENARDDKPGDHASNKKAAVDYTQIYTIEDDGHIKEDFSNEHTYITYKVQAVDANGNKSAVRTYHYHLHRPLNNGTDPESGYHVEQVLKADEVGPGSPAVWQICRDAESLRAMAWYIKGTDSGIVFDALQQKQGQDGGWSMKDVVDELADGQPYSFIVGHVHPDHAAQAAYFADAGMPIYVNERGWGSIGGYLGQNKEDKYKLVQNIDMGDQIDVGGAVFDVYALPGHTDDLVILADRTNGLVFATDIYGCTRAGSADNVSVSGIAADLLLTFAIQLREDYERLGTPVQYVFTGHDELPLDRDVLTNFELCLRNIVDNGNAAFTPTLRGGNNGFHAPTSMVGDMWKDYKNWLSLQTGNLSNGNNLYMKTTEEDAAINANLDYQDDGKNANTYSNETHSYDTSGTKYMTYSVLGNVEVEGGQFVGVDLNWKSPKTVRNWIGGETLTIPCTFHDMFNPWHYAYDIVIPEQSGVITIDAPTLSSKASITAITLDGAAVDSLENLAVNVGSEIKVTVTAQDGVSTSTYTFTVKDAESGAALKVSGAVSDAGVNTVAVDIEVKALRDLGAVVLGVEYDDSLILKDVKGVEWTPGDANLVLNKDIDEGASETITLIFDVAAGAKVNPVVKAIVYAAAGQDETDYAAGAFASGAGALCGDANADGKISAADLVRLRNYIGMDGAGITVGPGADVNGDGAVNGIDLTALNRYFATTAI